MFTEDGRIHFFKTVLMIERLRREFEQVVDSETKEKISHIFREASKTAYFLIRDDQSKPSRRDTNDDTLEIYP
jgi:hypothetical protein